MLSFTDILFSILSMLAPHTSISFYSLCFLFTFYKKLTLHFCPFDAPFLSFWWIVFMFFVTIFIYIQLTFPFFLWQAEDDDASKFSNAKQLKRKRTRFRAPSKRCRSARSSTRSPACHRQRGTQYEEKQNVILFSMRHICKPFQWYLHSFLVLFGAKRNLFLTKCSKIIQYILVKFVLTGGSCRFPSERCRSARTSTTSPAGQSQRGSLCFKHSSYLNTISVSFFLLLVSYFRFL